MSNCKFFGQIDVTCSRLACERRLKKTVYSDY